MNPNLPDGYRPIDDFPYYCVNDQGVVMSCRTKGGKFRDWTPMTPQWTYSESSQGRLFVGLRKGDKLYPKYIHLLVLRTFVGPCPDGMEGCHNDGNPENCAVSNLRWDSHRNNMQDRYKHGTDPTGVRNPSAILNESQVLEIRKLYRNGMLQKAIAPLFGVSKQCIQMICTRQTWSHI